MLTAIIGGVVLLLILALVIVVVRDPGPTPIDVSVSYEAAWSRLDFNTLWTISGDELRDGMNRVNYQVAKKSAYADNAWTNLNPVITIKSCEINDDYATVNTVITLNSDDPTINEINLTRRQGRWLVVGYRLISSGRT